MRSENSGIESRSGGPVTNQYQLSFSKSYLGASAKAELPKATLDEAKELQAIVSPCISVKVDTSALHTKMWASEGAVVMAAASVTHKTSQEVPLAGWIGVGIHLPVNHLPGILRTQTNQQLDR